MEDCEEKELTKFEPSEVVRFCDELTVDNYALRAFGVLLGDSNLEEFTGDPEEARDLRYGLRQIVELYVKRQERKLNELSMKSLNSFERVISQVKGTYEAVNHGAFCGSDVALEEVRTALNKINLVIAKCGDEYPQAIAIRDKLMKLRDAISSRKKNAGD